MTLILSKNILCRKFNHIYYILIVICIIYILFHVYKILFLSQRTTFITNTNISHYHLSSTNKNSSNEISIYYRHATSARNSSYPFISGDTFRAFSDYIYDETRQDNFNLIKYGDIVFLKTDMLSKFFSSSFNSIKEPFVLITHNSDYSAPDQYEKYLLNSKILMWYASNPNIENHLKLYPIPIGLANMRWPAGNLNKIIYAMKNHRKIWFERTNFLYVNFDVKTNKIQREKALGQALKIKNVQIIKQRITFENYLEQIGNTKFVLSPPGNGLDCHRTWEALLMGAVPIVLKSGLDPLFSKTNTIILNDWSNLTEQFLLAFNFSVNNPTVADVLYAQYWRDMLIKHRYSVN